MNNSEYIVEVTADNFVAEVMERSQTTPVLIDFWADWCAPCKALMPVLAKLADEYAGAFVLAKIDTEAEQMVAAQFGIRSLPTVVLMKDGQPVDHFMGALPESGLREFLEKHIEKTTASDNVGDFGPVQQAMAMLQSGQTDQAERLLNQIMANEPENAEAKIAMGEVQFARGDSDGAKATIENLSADDRELSACKSLRAKLTFAAIANEAGDSASILTKLENDPADHLARYQLSAQLVLQGQFESAMEQLLEIVKRDRGFQEDAGRKALVQIFDLLGGDDPLVMKFRGKLATILN